MKLFILVLFLVSGATRGGCQALELRGGRTALPGTMAALRYEHPSNMSLNLAGGVWYEQSLRNRLDYSVFGIELLTQYATGRDVRLISGRLSAGPVAELVNEPWIFGNASFADRLNYGLCLEGAGQLILSEVFSLSLFANQKYFFKRFSGHASFTFGIGIRYSFSIY